MSLSFPWAHLGVCIYIKVLKRSRKQCLFSSDFASEAGALPVLTDRVMPRKFQYPVSLASLVTVTTVTACSSLFRTSALRLIWPSVITPTFWSSCSPWCWWRECPSWQAKKILNIFGMPWPWGKMRRMLKSIFLIRLKFAETKDGLCSLTGSCILFLASNKERNIQPNALG